LFKEQIKERYTSLRAGVLNEINLIQMFEEFTDLIPPYKCEEDYRSTTANGLFKDIPSTASNHIGQIRDYIAKRLEYVDSVLISSTSSGFTFLRENYMPMGSAWMDTADLDLNNGDLSVDEGISKIKAFVEEFPMLMEHSLVTLSEAFAGLLLGILLGFVMAVIMDQFDPLYKACYPLIVLTQTIPTVAIAPLLVLWFGYEMAPKVILIVITTFFPITVGLLNGFKSADTDSINLLRAMGAGRWQIFRIVKLPGAMSQFFAGLRISASYAVVGAVISEWLGGFSGLGVYMTRVKKAFSFDKMFAVIFLISVISLLLMKGVDLLQKKCMPWEKE
jgi:ABC-type nitrate/sulfonate/bicarbonate transport system permease component